MHRTILNAPKGLVIDHLNHDGLDNRRSNLRLTNHSENRINSCKPPTSTTGFRGVSFHKHRGDYIAHIRKNGYLRHLGYFEEPVEAAKAYDRAARELHGKFAALNFPTSGKVRQMEFSFNPTSKKGRG